MRVPLRSSPHAVLALALVVACNQDKPKASETPKVEATPVPSGLVFNDFLPTTGTGGAGLGVRDSGVEGGLAAIASAGGGDEGANGASGASGTEGGGAEKVRITEAGAEPRALRKYTFVANRLDKRVLTIAQSITQSMGGQTSPPQDVTLKLSLDLTPKQVKPAGALIEVKVTKVDIPGAPPQATQMLAQMNGMTGTFEASPRGDVGEMSFMATPQMKNQMAESIVQGVSQAAQLLIVPFPDKPVGAGAKWELGGVQAADQGTKRFTLKEVTADSAVVDVDIDIKVPRRAQQNPRGGPPMFVEVDGKGKYSYQVRFDRSATKAEGELTINEKIEMTDPRAGGKQQVTQTQKAKHTIETPK